MPFRAHFRGCGLAKTLFSYQIANHLPAAICGLIRILGVKSLEIIGS